MRPLGVHHINVDDVEAAVAFSTCVLGLRRRRDRPDLGFGGAWLDVGGQQVHLIEGRPPAALGQQFALLVSDLDGAVAALRARAVEVTAPTPMGSSRQAFLTDPSGNVIELHQVG